MIFRISNVSVIYCDFATFCEHCEINFERLRPEVSEITSMLCNYFI